MASFRERAEADLKGTTVEAIQAQNSAKSNKSFRERAQEDLSRSSQQANTAYRTKQRRQKLHAEEQERKRAEQNKVQMQKIGKQTNRQRFDTGENESRLGYGNYLSYKGTDQREIPWKQMTQDQITKAKQEAAEKQAATRKATSRGGGFGANGAVYEAKPSLGKTILNVANKGAGEGFVTPVYETLDFLANLAPNAVAGIKGVEDPESTFTGQLFKPVTDATQKALDYVKGETGASAAIVQKATKGNKAAQLAADIGSGVVGAIPNAALAIMTAGGSLPALAPQTAGASGTIMNAVQKVASNPSFQLSYIQTLGGAYQDAKDAGASELNASAAAFISAAANALVEAGGGLETLPGELKAEDLSTFYKALKWVTSALDEGKEEVVQGVISSLTNKAAANSDAPYFSTTDENAVINPARMGKEFGMGTAVGAVLGGAQMFGTDAINRISNRHTGANADSNANTGSNADATVTQPLRNAESDYADIDTETAAQVTDPMEYAVRETMKPSKERQAMDEAIRRTADWMNGKKESVTAEAETLVADTTRFDIKILENLNKARTYFIDYAKTHFPTSVVNKETGKTVDISRKGLDKFLSGRIPKEKYASGFHIPELIERAYKVDTANNYHADQVGNAPTYEYYDSPIKIGDTDYTAHIRVKNSVMGDKYYGHTISEVDNIEIEPSARTSVPEKPAVQPVHAIDDSISTIPHSNQNVNQNQKTNLDNDMGAKKSDFAHETKKSRGNTTPDYETANNVPESARTDPNYIAVTEAESNHNATLRLDQDYDGEVEELRRKAAWSAEEMSMGRMILEDLRVDGDESGDYSAYQDWAKVFEAHKQEGGRALQNLAQINRRTGAGIMQEAASVLDDGTLRKGVDSNAVLKEISEDANRFDAARTSKNVDDLVQLIKDTAAERNTGFRRRKDGTQKQSKYLNWALDRIAGYAKSGKLTGNVDPNLQIDASNIQNPDVAFQFLQDFASTGILNIAADTQKVSMGTKLMALRRSGMLSKLATTLRNLSSNSGFNIVDTIARDVSVPLDMLLSNFTKTRSVAMDYGYLSKAARQGSLDNIAMASLETSLDVNGRRNSGKYTSGGMRTFKANGNIVERFLSNLEALQGYEMYVTDEMSKGRTQAGVQEGINDLYPRKAYLPNDARARREQRGKQGAAGTAAGED